METIDELSRRYVEAKRRVLDSGGLLTAFPQYLWKMAAQQRRDQWLAAAVALADAVSEAESRGEA